MSRGGGGAWGFESPSSHGPNEGIPQGNSPDAPANTPQRCNGGANDTTSEVTAAEAGAAWSRVPCPVCNVAPGYYCRVPGGVPGFVHQGRLQADAEPQGAAPAAAAAAPVAGSTPQPSGADVAPPLLRDASPRLRAGFGAFVRAFGGEASPHYMAPSREREERRAEEAAPVAVPCDHNPGSCSCASETPARETPARGLAESQQNQSPETPAGNLPS